MLLHLSLDQFVDWLSWINEAEINATLWSVKATQCPTVCSHICTFVQQADASSNQIIYVMEWTKCKHKWVWARLYWGHQILSDSYFVIPAFLDSKSFNLKQHLDFHVGKSNVHEAQLKAIQSSLYPRPSTFCRKFHRKSLFSAGFPLPNSSFVLDLQYEDYG